MTGAQLHSVIAVFLKLVLIGSHLVAASHSLIPSCCGFLQQNVPPRSPRLWLAGLGDILFCKYKSGTCCITWRHLRGLFEHCCFQKTFEKVALPSPWSPNDWLYRSILNPSKERIFSPLNGTSLRIRFPPLHLPSCQIEAVFSHNSHNLSLFP